MEIELINILLENDEHDKFSVGLDWLISEEGKPYFLEFNLRYPGEGDDDTYSRTRHFLEVSSDKINQHQIFAELMPEFTIKTQEFPDFVNRHSGKVVYKARGGSEGKGVSVIQVPEWKPDLIESFIQPKTLLINGRHFPYIIRDYFVLTVDKKNLFWNRTKTYRTKSINSLEDEVSPNSNLKLNIASGIAHEYPIDENDLALIDKLTPKAIQIVIDFAQKANWNPLAAFRGACIGSYFGYRKAFFASPLDNFEPTVELLNKRGIDCASFCIVGGLVKAIKAADYGSDLVLLRNSHSIKWYDDTLSLPQRSYYSIERALNGDIIHRRTNENEGYFERFPAKPNVIIENETPSEELVDRIAHKDF